MAGRDLGAAKTSKIAAALGALATVEYVPDKLQLNFATLLRHPIAFLLGRSLSQPAGSSKASDCGLVHRDANVPAPTLATTCPRPCAPHRRPGPTQTHLLRSANNILMSSECGWRPLGGPWGAGAQASSPTGQLQVLPRVALRFPYLPIFLLTLPLPLPHFPLPPLLNFTDSNSGPPIP